MMDAKRAKAIYDSKDTIAVTLEESLSGSKM